MPGCTAGFAVRPASGSGARDDRRGKGLGVEGAAQFVRSMGAARLAAMGAVAATLIGIFAVIIMRLTTPTMVPLYTDLAFSDSASIIRELESRSVPFELRRDGSVVMVPQEQVLRLRMDLAASGLPSGGSIGYEIFDRGETLGATSFVQNVNHIRALEGELSRTIRTIDRVGAVRVHLVIPERQLFTRDRPEPSASIVLQVARRAGSRPDPLDPASRGRRGARAHARPRLGRRRGRPPPGRRSRQRVAGLGPHARRAPHRHREPYAFPDRGHPRERRRPRPRPRTGRRRARLQPDHPDGRFIRPRKPRPALQPDARGGGLVLRCRQ